MQLSFAHLANTSILDAPLVRTSLRTSRGVVGQVAVAIVAAFCVTAITDLCLRSDPPPARAAAIVTLDSAAVVGLLNAAFTPDGIRNRPRYPMEFETVLGPTSTATFARYASAEWPATVTRFAALERTVPDTLAAPAPPVRTRAAVAHPRAPASPVPPVRVAGLGLPAATPSAPVVSIATTPGAAASETRRATILGVSLPGFVPTGDDIVRTVVSLAGSVAGSIPRI